MKRMIYLSRVLINISESRVDYTVNMQLIQMVLGNVVVATRCSAKI